MTKRKLGMTMRELGMTMRELGMTKRKLGMKMRDRNDGECETGMTTRKEFFLGLPHL